MGGEVIFMLPCLFCMDNHGCNIQRSMEMTVPPMAIEAVAARAERHEQDGAARVLPGPETNRRFGPLSALGAHTKAPCKNRFAVGNAKGA